MEYEFLFRVDGITLDDELVIAALVEQLDVQLSESHRVYRLSATAEGTNPVEAVQGLLQRLAAIAPAMTVLRTDLDLVGVADIAERVDRSRQNVQQWIDGERKAGGPAFPAPEGLAGRSLVWSWAEVNAWLEQIGQGDGSTYPTRDEALMVDLVLMQWRQAAVGGLPMLRFLAIGDDRAGDRQAVMSKLMQAVNDPQFVASIASWPHGRRRQVSVVCAVLLDPLTFVLEQLGGETSGFLAVLTDDDELHCVPIASERLPGTMPIVDFGLTNDATVGDLVLLLRNGRVSSASPLALG